MFLDDINHSTVAQSSDAHCEKEMRARCFPAMLGRARPLQLEINWKNLYLKLNALK